MMRAALFSWVFPLLAVGAAAQAAPPPYVVQETGRSFTRLLEAVDSVQGGDATVLIAPGTYKDCEVVEHGRVAFRARQPGTVIFDGGICEGKGSLVLRGVDALVDGIIFQNQHVPEGNGAGIRLEHGGLTVTNSVFRNADEGILTSDDALATIRVDRSSFAHLGRCDRGLSCAHALYVGHYGRLIVTHSRFEKADGGHYIKSRARVVQIADNSIDDSQGRLSNYLIDLPSGATGLIANNVMVQGPNKENRSGAIVVAAEERPNPSKGLTITGNTLTRAPGATYATAFVVDYSHDPLSISGNTIGRGIKPFESR